ncbi:MAG: AraC family transcriptional regulator [Treponemataceae bacterium]|nr:AraC family transcriptional regulator [Treponemataceae bacterium]
MPVEPFRETKIHGSLNFPFIVYNGNIPEYLRHFPLHWHDEFEIISIESGTGFISVQSESFTCRAGDIFLIPPGCIHTIFQKEAESMRYFNILFRFTLLEEDQNSVCFKKYFRPFSKGGRLSKIRLERTDALNQKIAPYVKTLIENRHESADGFELMVKSALYAILFYIKDILVPASETSAAQDYSIERLRPILQYIREQFAEGMTVESAAARANLSPSHFMKTFKRLTGSTFTSYVNLYRLESAALMLRTTDKSVLEICGECGFRNFSYFIRAFKKSYGMTPGAFQKTARRSAR